MEAYLHAAEWAPGFSAALLRIAAEARAEESIRQAAAIYIKHLVRRRWAPPSSAGPPLPEEEKAALRDGLLEGAARAADSQRVLSQLAESFRIAAHHDFPEAWPGLVDRLLAGLRSAEAGPTRCGLLLLRKLYKQLEARPSSCREDMEALCSQTLPTLLGLMAPLGESASGLGPRSVEAFGMIKTVMKCTHSAVYMAVGEHVQRSIDAWMPVVLAVAQLPLPPGTADAEAEDRESSPPAKCRKWAFAVLFRLFHRHGNPRRVLDGMAEFASAWSARYAVPVTEVSLREVCGVGQGLWVPRRSLSLAFLCLAEAVTREVTYEVMRPALQPLLGEGIFFSMRFSEADAQLWRHDPQELVRRSYQDPDEFKEPRVAAVDLVEKLVRHRKRDVLGPLLHFCCGHLHAHAGNPMDAVLCANKDGALALLGCMSEELLSLDPAQARRSGGTRDPREAGDPEVSVAELLASHVRPDMLRPTAFLRMRACWLYETLGEGALGPPGAAADVCCQCLRLTGDPELPVRVRAATCLQVLLQTGHEEVLATVAQDLAILLERLLGILAEVQCDEIAETLEALVGCFPHQIIPHAPQLVAHLVAHFCQLAQGEGDDCEEGAAASAMRSMQAILAILESCASLPQGSARADLFARLAEELCPLLSQLLRPEGADFLEEGLEALAVLARFGPSPPRPQLWALVPQLYQAVCGRSTPSLPLLKDLCEGYAPEIMPQLVDPLLGLLCQGPPEAFLAGHWQEGQLTYPEMLFAMFRKAMRTASAGYEGGCAGAARLAAGLFEAASPPVADAWLPRYFKELWRRTPRAETADLQRELLLAFSAMVWYDAGALLRCAEERRCAPQLFEFWVQRMSLIRCPAHRKRLVLGLSRMLQLGS